MASPRPLRSLLSTAPSALGAAQPARRALVPTSARAFATTTPARSPDYDTETAARPRWQQTPPRMVAPFRVRPKPRGPDFKVNDDPRRLDEAYTRMLGPGGDKVLSDEVKWLAVTHKSFDHGRRGFNDRLAYLGVFQRPKARRRVRSC
jgi:large subunit ribosomal protein L15